MGPRKTTLTAPLRQDGRRQSSERKVECGAAERQPPQDQPDDDVLHAPALKRHLVQDVPPSSERYTRPLSAATYSFRSSAGSDVTRSAPSDSFSFSQVAPLSRERATPAGPAKYTSPLTG